MAFLKRRGKIYHACWWERGPAGRKKKYKTLKTSDLQTALKRIAALNEELEARRQGIDADITWELFCKFYKEYALANKERASYDRDLAAIKRFDELLPVRKLKDLTPWMLDKYKIERKQAGVKESTINRELNTLKAMTAKARFWKYLSTDPWQGISKYQIQPGKPVTFEGKEDQIRRGCADAYDLVLCDLGLYSGLRRGEMCNLKWEDVDFEKGSIRVVSTVGRRTKSKKERFLPLHPKTRKDLLKLRKEGDKEFVLGRNGERTSADYLSRRFVRILGWAGIEEGHLHLTRHTFGSKLANSKVNLKTVMELLGHSRLTTTQIYLHSNEEAKKKAVESL